MHKCNNPSCPNLTENPKFCSSSCSASFNNLSRNSPKRVAKRVFCKCGEDITRLGKINKAKSHNKRRLCDKCLSETRVDWENLSILELQALRKYQRNSRIRDNARKVYSTSNKPKYCKVCGYSKHYEVHHIKPIHSFEENSTLQIVNHIDNLVALCPTHHWEVDNNIIDILGYLT